VKFSRAVSFEDYQDLARHRQSRRAGSRQRLMILWGKSVLRRAVRRSE
jgi:hypothetical protein